MIPPVVASERGRAQTAALLALVLAASAALPVFAADTAPTDTIYINSVSDQIGRAHV